MPRISSQAGRSLANIATKRVIPDYPFSGPNISASATKTQLGGGNRIANTSTWTFDGASVTFVGTGLPYHSYGSEAMAYTPANQNYRATWPYRGGSRVESPTPINQGLIGFWLNGVAMYNQAIHDATPYGYEQLTGYTYNGAYQAGKQFGYNFGEDLAGGHTASPDQYHYHDGSFLSVWLSGAGHTGGQWGETGIAEASLINYLKSGLTHPDGHSKILGIAADGYPVYGPFGYNVAMSADSGVERMISGYKLFPTSNRAGTVAENLIAYPMGIFLEDYHYTAAGDLDQHNGRYCVTPDYPNGTYAYFITMDADLKPQYPYIIGETFYGKSAII